MIIGYYGFGNAGDEWLLRKCISYLKHHKPQAHYHYLCGPSPSISSETISPVPRSSFLSIYQAIKTAPLVVVGGGGLFQDSTSFKSLLYYCSLILIAHRFNKEIVMLGQGFSPLRYSHSKTLLKWTLNRARVEIEVRDQDSATYLNTLNIDQCNITVGKDLAFYNEDSPKHTQNLQKTLSNLETLATSKKDVHIGVSLRQKQDLPTLSLPKNSQIHYISTQKSEDNNILSQWPNQLPRHSTKHSLVDLFEKKSKTPSLDHIITMRYHTAIWAILNNIPCTIIPIDQKLRSLATEYNLESIPSIKKPLDTPPLDHINFWNYSITDSTLDEVVSKILVKIQDKTSTFCWISTLNPELIMKAEHAPSLHQHYQDAWLRLADGIGLVWAINHRHKTRINRICGSDIVPALLAHPISIYVLGATNKNCQKAVENIQRDYPSVKICGHHHGYFSESEKKQILSTIVDTQPDLVLVGLGCPKQEEFIHDLHKNAKRGIAIGVGGVIDMIAGNVKRAPKWVQRCHLEWLYRVFQQPNRITRLKIIFPFIHRVLSK